MPKNNNLARKLSKIPAFRVFAVSLDSEVASEYEQQAGDGRDIGAVLSDRLLSCVTHTAEKPLYFSDEQRRELDGLLDKNFSSAEQVNQHIRSLHTVLKVRDKKTATVQLTPNQLYRLTDRARVAGLSVEDFAAKLAVEAINKEIGLY